MIQNDEIIGLMRGTVPYTDTFLSHLSDITEEYPYFQSAHLLRTLNLLHLEDSHYLVALRKTAIYMPDRKQLYFWVEKDFFNQKLKRDLKKESYPEDLSYETESWDEELPDEELIDETELFDEELIDETELPDEELIDETELPDEELIDEIELLDEDLIEETEIFDEEPIDETETLNKEPKEPKEPKEQKEPKELKELKEQKEQKEPKEPKEQKEQKEQKELKEQKEPKEPKKPTPETIFKKEFTPAAFDYVSYFLSDSAENEDVPPLQHQATIDKFLEKDAISPVKIKLSKISESKEEMPEPVPDLPEKEEFFTETLAKIYIKQKRYDKALEILHQLNLIYPEKSRYFADQIQYLEKLNIYTNKIN